jgi:hypothetical protein
VTASLIIEVALLVARVYLATGWDMPAWVAFWLSGIDAGCGGCLSL